MFRSKSVTPVVKVLTHASIRSFVQPATPTMCQAPFKMLCLKEWKKDQCPHLMKHKCQGHARAVRIIRNT